jgi:hypothetical protein
VNGDGLFIVHHRRGTSKKVSSWLNDPNCSVDGVNSSMVLFDCSVDFGSSGSSIFDTSGRIVANLSTFQGGASSVAIWEDVRTEPLPTRDVDVAVVLDRSGSMSLPGRSGAPKITEAKQAAALFVSLLTTAGGNRVGLVSFSTTATPDRALANVNPGTKGALVGSIPPATAGLIGGLTANGMTTIGGGLQTALGYFPPPSPTANTRAVLLMTDGLENTAPMLSSVEPLLAAAARTSSASGPPRASTGPSTTARAHEASAFARRRPESKKYCPLGRIFDLGTALTRCGPPAGQQAASPVDVDVCAKRLIVLDGRLRPILWRSFDPLVGQRSMPDGRCDRTSGDTWQHLTLPLPFNGEQDGRWQVIVVRLR